ncbi:MAG: GNAT family N-acetyltransferase [Kordiimonadaceae bacterium]|nr:GNAT family N-acetyltransferase [Kordiimonadaceae bacterium]
MIIREATDPDFPRIWPILRATVRAGQTYALDRDLSEQEAKTIWLTAPQRTYIVEDEGVLLGTYKLSANKAGPGNHVCNCGYIVCPEARGRGVATLMCKHSQEITVELGFRAMQFNSVVATNKGAVRLWQSLGFDIVGTLPKAFNHPTHGFVDAYVMYKWLAD